MSEENSAPVNVLEYHYQRIGRVYGNLKNRGLTFPECERLAREEDLVLLREKILPFGRPTYPGLQTEKGAEKFVTAVASVLYAITQDKARIIPDVDPTTRQRNFDPICHTCGNKRGRRCVLERYANLIQ